MIQKVLEYTGKEMGYEGNYHLIMSVNFRFMVLCISDGNNESKKSTRCTIVLKSLKLYRILIPLYMFRALSRPSSGAS
jgi:hypothetical protein